jgi:hypothetical protein
MNHNSGEELRRDNVSVSNDFACPSALFSSKLNPEYAINSIFQTVGAESIAWTVGY